jgi:hypothetical protein
LARFNVLYANMAIISLLGAATASATTITIPPFVPASPYTLLSGDTLELSSNLAATALVLQPETIFTIASGAEMTYGATPAISTTGAGGATTFIVIEPQSFLDAGTFDAIDVLATDDVNIDIQGSLTGNISFTNPGTNITSIYGGGVVTGNITGLTGVLNLDGEQPVVGNITAPVGSDAILNLGFTSSIDFTLNNALANIPNIFVKNGSFIVAQNISNITVFDNYEKGSVTLNAILNGTGVGGVNNYGNFEIDTGGSITNITSFTNYPGASVYINVANSLNLANVVNDGLMYVNAAINPVTFSNGANSNADLYLNANLTTTNPFINGNGNNAAQMVVGNAVTINVPSLTNSAGSGLEFEGSATITASSVINNGNLIINIPNTATFTTLLTCSGTLDLENGTLTVISSLPAPTTPITLSNAISATSISLPHAIVSDANIFGTFTASLNATGNNLSLTYTRVPLNDILARDPNTLTTSLESMATATTPTTGQTQIVSLVQQNSPTQDEYKAVLTKLMPMVIQKTAHQLHRSGMKAVLIRIAELTNAKKAYVAGDVLSTELENNLWFRPYYSHVKQTENLDKGLLGYRNNIYGASLGVDTSTLLTKQLVGLAINISKSNIVDQNYSTARTMNYQGIAYGKYNFDSKIYMDWMGSIGVSQSKQKRMALDDFPAYSALQWTQYSLRTSLGYQFFSDYLFTVEPDISLQYTFLNNNDYTETGPSVTNLTVHPLNNNYLVTGLGVRTYLNLAKFNYNFSSSIFARADYTVIGKNIETVVNFVNVSAPSFTTKASPNKMLFSVGASACYNFGSVKVELLFNYDFTRNYRDQQYYLNMAYKF